MPLLDIFRSVISPITGLIDSLHTSEEEKLQAKASLLGIQTALTERVLAYEAQLADAQAKVVLAEAQGQSWLQRNWRPLVMMLFAYIIFNNYVLSPYFSLPKLDLPPDLWGLMKIGMGGYVVGRSAEKIVPQVVEALKSKEK